MNDNFKIINAWCNRMENPLGIDSTPYFSWRMGSERKRDTQVAFRLGVSDNLDDLQAERYTIWDSGTVETDNNLHVHYAGVELLAETSYWWQVTAWNQGGSEAKSVPCTFETGKRGNPWDARWIGAPFIGREESSYVAPYFFKKITLKEPPISARLYVCGLGYYEAYIEGEKVGDALLDPAFTKFDQRAYYSVYDALPLLHQKEIGLGVILGNGWYNGINKDNWRTREATWRANPKLIAELHVTYADGTTETICSDSSWKASPGPIVFNGLRNGEHYDARLELGDWSHASYDHDSWENAMIMRGAGGVLLGREIPPIRQASELIVRDFWQNQFGNWVFDLGQNFAGQIRLTTTGAPDQEIKLVYGEQLTEDKEQVSQDAIKHFVQSGEFQTDYYTRKSHDTEVWTQKFVYHGYRYVEISGLDSADKDTVVGLVLHTDFARTGHFETSSQRLNQIYDMCHWSFISNFHSAPTDCPQREKNSWTGDAAIVLEQGLLNYDSFRAWKKWLDDLCDSQRPNGMIPCVVPSTSWGYNWGNGPDWSNALTELPWFLYLHSGDQQILEQYYPYIRKHFEFMSSMSENGLLHYGIGDWCAPFEGEALSVNMGSFKAPVPLTDTAFYYYSASILGKIENILGYEPMHQHKAEAIKETLRSTFYDYDLHDVAGHCQTSASAFLYYDLLEDTEKGKLTERLLNHVEDADGHLDYGILGSKWVPNSLAAAGFADVVYGMMNQTTYPSYQHWMDLGITALGEIWNGKGSQNHYMFSDISAVFIKHFGGIQLQENTPAFREFLLKPALFDTLDSLSCHHQCVHGTIAIQWKKQDEVIHLTIEIPFGTTAILTLPPYVTGQNPLPSTLGSGRHEMTLLLTP